MQHCTGITLQVAYIIIYNIINVRSSKSKNIVASTVIIDYANMLEYILPAMLESRV